MQKGTARIRFAFACIASLLLAACAGESTVTPPTSVTSVLATPVTSLTASLTQGDSLVQGFDLTASSDAISWTASANVPWIAVSPNAGATPVTMTAVVRTLGLPVGASTGTVTVVPSNGSAPITIVVSLTVTSPVTISVPTTPLAFTGIANGAAAPAQSVAIGANGSAALQWTANGSAAWIVVAPSAGTAPGTLTIGANPGGLAVGTYQGFVTVSANGAVNSPQTIPVSLLVGGYHITVSASPSTSGTVQGAGDYAAGANATLNAVPAAGFRFVDWSSAGSVVATTASYTFTVTADRALVATFGLQTVSIIANASPSAGGTVTGAGNVTAGSTVTLQATPQSAYTFSSWTENGAVVSTNATYSFTASGDRTLTANFVPTISSNLSVQIQQPVANGASRTDTLIVQVQVSSVYSISSVTGTVGNTTVTLSLSPLLSANYAGKLPLTGLAFDTFTVVVKAIDVKGGFATNSQHFYHDRQPVLTVLAPTDLDVARPNFSYSATCTDDDPAGCSSLVLYYLGAQRYPVQTSYPLAASPTLLAQGKGSLTGTYSLAADDGKVVGLRFDAVDSRGQIVQSKIINVLVEASAQVDSIGSAAGAVLDYRGGIALSAPGGAYTTPTLRNVATGADQVIQAPASATGYVTSAGAILTDSAQIYDWRNGSLSSAKGYLSAIDTRATYAVLDLFSVGTVRRDLATGNDVALTHNSVIAVAPTGDYVYTTISGLHFDFVNLWHNGTSTQLASGENSRAVADGINVVAAGGAGTGYPVYLYDGSKTINLSVRSSSNYPVNFDANSGWAAFIDGDQSNTGQVFLRSLTGTISQLSQFPASSTIDALGADGSVVFHTATQRYLATAAGALHAVGSANGSVVWRNGEFDWLLGRAVFRLK